MKVGDKVVVNKGNLPVHTIQSIDGPVVWFEDSLDNCFLCECFKYVHLESRRHPHYVKPRTITAEKYGQNKMHYDSAYYATPINDLAL